jgi:hypothetical protein
VEVTALSEALGASAQAGARGCVVTTLPTRNECDDQTVQGQKFSEQFRTDVAVADEVESLRAVVLRKEKISLGPRFDAVDKKLTLSTPDVQTDADMAVTMRCPMRITRWRSHITNSQEEFLRTRFRRPGRVRDLLDGEQVRRAC